MRRETVYVQNEYSFKNISTEENSLIDLRKNVKSEGV